MHILFINILVLLALLGFLLSFYIHSKKKSKKKLICPLSSNCDTVIHSDYSRILGIPVEVLGMMYYALIGIGYTFSFITNIWSREIGMVLLGVSLCAGFFSLYLVSLQAFVVKHWCTWCLSSAFISISIAVISYLNFTI